jgi:hypothetical protein
MKRFLFALSVALGLLCSVGVARGEGADNVAAGTGTLICCEQPMVHVNAQSQQGGIEPRGHFWIRYPSGVEFGGRVVCLSVAGNSAGLTGRIEKVKVPNPARGFTQGNFVNLRVTDMGSPGTLDLVNFDSGTAVRPAACPMFGNLETQQGNYVVHSSLVDLSLLNALLMGFEAEAGDPYGMNG